MANDIQALRDILFETMRGLNKHDKPVAIDRAKAVAELSQQVINTAKVEIDYMRVTKAGGTGFIAAALPSADTPPQGDTPAAGLPLDDTPNETRTATGTGTKHIAKVPGGTVITHTIR